MKLNCIIVDDEPIAREIIERYLEPFDQITLVGKCSNAIEANVLLQKNKIDLIFLDIEMPQINGLALVKSLENRPKVIITTAYREYALEGFELNAVDYLLKPISQERFLKAINRVLVKPNMPDVSNPLYIYLKVDLKMVQVFLDEILYIQGLSNYVKVYCKERMLVTYQKLSHLEEVLPTNKFVRSHRSYIVNLSKITSYTHQDIEIGKHELPIGGRYKDEMLERLSQFKA